MLLSVYVCVYIYIYLYLYLYLYVKVQQSGIRVFALDISSFKVRGKKGNFYIYIYSPHFHFEYSVLLISMLLSRFPSDISL